MSFAPRDSHEAQVQFALERGVPAVIGVLGSIKLPYPSRAFDMAHCSRCLIPWGENGNMLCLENIIVRNIAHPQRKMMPVQRCNCSRLQSH
jgi:Putative S-adenosyl-L-methionine-dependent methyltransferase